MTSIVIISQKKITEEKKLCGRKMKSIFFKFSIVTMNITDTNNEIKNITELEKEKHIVGNVSVAR